MKTFIKMSQMGQNAWAGSALAAIGAYMAPMTEILIVLLIFVIFDLIFGILASRRAQIPFSSKRLRQSIMKVISYFSAILLLYAAEKTFGFEWLDLYKLTGGFICFVELLSIFENLAILTEKPIFLKIIKIIRGRASEKYGAMIGDILDDKKPVN